MSPHDVVQGRPWTDGDPKKVRVADYSKIGSWMLFNTYGGTITIKKNAFFGQRCMLLAGDHDITLKNGDRFNQANGVKDIVIEEGVYVGAGSIIIGPCTIGAHSVVGAGSVVLPGHYEGGRLFAGNPAKFKKEIQFKE